MPDKTAEELQAESDAATAKQRQADEAEREPVVETPPVTAKSRLRAFEDDAIGEDAVRISDQIERGSGSLYQTVLTPEQRAQHAALEKLVEAEQRVADTSAALATAQIAHDQAVKYVETCEAVSKNADAERKRKASEAEARREKRDAEQHV